MSRTLMVIKGDREGVAQIKAAHSERGIPFSQSEELTTLGIENVVVPILLGIDLAIIVGDTSPEVSSDDAGSTSDDDDRYSPELWCAGDDGCDCDDHRGTGAAWKGGDPNQLLFPWAMPDGPDEGRT